MIRRGAGTLHIIGGLMIASAVLRVIDSGAAMAESSPKENVTEAMPAPTIPAMSPETPDALLKAFRDREARLQQREAQLEDRMQALQLAEDEFAEQLAALTAAEEALRGTIALAEDASQNDLERLTTVYQNMKPKDAAALFEQMSPGFAAGFLGLMDPVAAAQIMTLLAPETSYSISVVLAGRNANVPTE